MAFPTIDLESFPDMYFLVSFPKEDGYPSSLFTILVLP